MSSFWENPDLLVTSGSHLYGCSTKDSDLDLRGFVLEPAEYLLGRKTFNEKQSTEDDDTVIWGFQHFLKQISRPSPNIFEILFAPQDKVNVITDVGKTVLDNKELFLHQGIFKPFMGFAFSEWNKCQLKHVDKNTGEIRSSTRVVGAKRKQSYSEHGYSVKNAYHAVRLLSQIIELCDHGTITFPRPEASLLISIRNGEISFSDLEGIYNSLDIKAKNLSDKNCLPKKIDMSSIDELYYDIVSPRISQFLNNRVRHFLNN